MIKRLLLLILSVVFLGEARAQLFPAQATTQLTPPYSLFLADYVAPGSERLALHVFLRDVSRPDINVRFRLRIIGQGIIIETKPEFIPSPVSLQGGVPLRLIGIDLAEYFEPRNLNFSGISQREYEQRGGLPEGLYQFCFEVLEYNRGVKISNTGCASAWLILNDPPIVNLPRDNDRIRPQDPQQVIFQWTPRHTGSPNAAFTTEYEFKLVELWPATRNPNDAILTSPPIFETTTRSTTLVYGPAETPLELGRRYAFQIKAKSIVGVEELNLFKNGGKSQVYTFQYGEACNVPQRILAEASGATRFTVAWDAANSHTAWKLRYRQNTPDAEWYTATSSLPELEITSLQPTTTYEYEVRATCGSFESPYSPIATITTRETPTLAYSCGLPVEDFNLDPSQLIPELKKGDVIDAGDFDVKLLTVSGGNGIFSGEGAIEVPYFNQVKAKVVFENIKVNNDKRLVAGVMNVTGGGVEIVPEGVMDFMDQLSEVLDIADSALNIIDALIPNNPPDPATFIADTLITVTGPLTVYPDLSNNGSVIMVDGSGNQQTLPPGKNYAITDDKGNGYLVDNKGQVTRTTAAQATASANREFNLKMKFEKASDGLYGLDSKTIEALARNYEILNNNYSVSWKAVAANSNERVVAKLEDAGIDASRVKYELSGTELVATTAGEQGAYLLNIIGKSAGTVDELVGKLPAASENDKEQVLGKLNVVSYDKKNYKLVLVPVNHSDNNKTEYPHNIDQLKVELNKIYSQAVVEWTVRSEANLVVSGLSDTFDDGQSNALSNYTEDMKKVINAFLANHSFEEDTYYIFLLNKPKTANKLGFMPRKKQAGFVFLNTHSDNEALLVKTIAHELAHGAFRLQHLWEEYSAIRENTTDNLMDYTNGTKLMKFQWDLIHDPVAVLGLFESDEEGASKALFDSKYVRLHDDLGTTAWASNKGNDEFTQDIIAEVDGKLGELDKEGKKTYILFNYVWFDANNINTFEDKMSSLSTKAKEKVGKELGISDFNLLVVVNAKYDAALNDGIKGVSFREWFYPMDGLDAVCTKAVRDYLNENSKTKFTDGLNDALKERATKLLEKLKACEIVVPEEIVIHYKRKGRNNYRTWGEFTIVGTNYKGYILERPKGDKPTILEECKRHPNGTYELVYSTSATGTEEKFWDVTMCLKEHMAYKLHGGTRVDNSDGCFLINNNSPQFDRYPEAYQANEEDVCIRPSTKRRSNSDKNKYAIANTYYQHYDEDNPAYKLKRYIEAMETQIKEKYKITEVVKKIIIDEQDEKIDP